MPDFSKLQAGLTGSATMLVTQQRLATTMGSGNVPVFASPMLVAAMEAAAVDCLDGQLPDGYESVGVHLDVAHSAPTPLGFTVTATATLTAVDGRKLAFDVAAHDGVERIGSGTHSRIIVDTPRFFARLAAKSPPRA